MSPLNTNPTSVKQSPTSLSTVSTPTLIPPQSDELVIVVDDDDDDEINKLAKHIDRLTVYSVGGLQTTSYWSTGAAAQRNGSPVKAEGTRIRYHLKPTAWVVYIGIVPGVYHRWVDAENQVLRQSRTIVISYHSRHAAARAFAFAQSKDWVASTLDTEHPLIRPRPVYRLSLTRPKVHFLSSSTPIGTGLSRPAWYVVYVGIRPGVYDNFLQVSMNVTGIPDSSHDATNTREDAVKLYMRAHGLGEIGTCTAIE